VIFECTRTYFRVHRATGVQCWPDLSTFPPACLCAPNIPLSSALHSGTLWAYGGQFDRDGCAGTLLPSNGSCHTHTHTHAHTPTHTHTNTAALHSTPPASAGQLALSTERMDWRPGNQETDHRGAKGLHTGKLLSADETMQERHVAEGCEQV